MKKANFKKFVFKIVLVIISITIKLEDFDFNNIVIDENHMKIFWYMTLHTKL